MGQYPFGSGNALRAMLFEWDPMASVAKLQAESAAEYPIATCSVCGGQGRILYPFAGNSADQPLGGIKIRAVSCLQCDGSGHKSIAAVEKSPRRQ